VFNHYQERLNTLFTQDLSLKRIFPKCIFPAAALNFGPKVCSFRHRDVLNCPYGWCAIYAFGNFNPVAGGHLYLWDLGIVVEFPPNSLVLIPSATVEHSNSPIAKDEERVSFTLFCGGGLFRWVDNGFRTEKQLKEQNSKEYLMACEKKTGRWKEGLALLRKYEDIAVDAI
jgi:hypothetical protein